MSDEKPELTKTEARQANSRKMNFRVLAVGLAVIVIAFAIVFWISTATQDDTETGVDAGATLEEGGPDDGTMEEAPLPTPEEENLVE